MNPIPTRFRLPDPIRTPDPIRLSAIGYREIGRFLHMPMNAVIGPAITSCLFYAVFALAYGEAEVNGMAKSLFIAPGAILLAAIQNAFHTSIGSFVGGKVHGSLDDVMMSPLAVGEWIAGHLAAGIARALLIALLIAALLWPFGDIPLAHPLAALFWIAGTGAIFAMLGMMGGLVTERFDSMNNWGSFVVAPMSFLCGSFFSIAALPEPWSTILLFNPATHVMDGFRWAMLGVADYPLWRSTAICIALVTTLVTTNAMLIKRGFGLKS